MNNSFASLLSSISTLDNYGWKFYWLPDGNTSAFFAKAEHRSLGTVRSDFLSELQRIDGLAQVIEKAAQLQCEAMILAEESDVEDCF